MGKERKGLHTLDLTELRTNVGTTINNTRSNPGPVCELAGLIVNLRDKLTGGGKDQGCRVCLALAAEVCA